MSGVEMAGKSDSRLPYGPGSKLWTYWESGPGAAKWQTNPHPWTTLHALLKAAGVPARFLDGLTTNLYFAHFHHMPNQK